MFGVMYFLLSFSITEEEIVIRHLTEHLHVFFRLAIYCHSSLEQWNEPEHLASRFGEYDFLLLLNARSLLDQNFYYSQSKKKGLIVNRNTAKRWRWRWW